MATEAAIKTTPAPGAKLWDKPKKNTKIDVSTIKIDRTTVYSPELLRPKKPGKYDHLFENMKVGQSLICKPTECGAIGAAMRNWAIAKKMIADIKEVTNFQNTGKGRVFLLELKPEIDSSSVTTRPLLVNGASE